MLEQQARSAARDAAENGGGLPEADPRAQPDAAAVALAVQNGEGESLGVSSGVLQVLSSAPYAAQLLHDCFHPSLPTFQMQAVESLLIAHLYVAHIRLGIKSMLTTGQLGVRAGAGD